MNRWNAAALVIVLVTVGCGGADVAVSPSGANQPQRVAATAPATVGDLASLAQRARLLPPQVVFGGGPSVPSQGSLEFQTDLPPERVVAWYRSAARTRAFRIDSELQEGAEHVLNLTAPPPAGALSVRIQPGIRGGSTALLLFEGR